MILSMKLDPKKEKYRGSFPIRLKIPFGFYNPIASPKLYRKQLAKIELALETILHFKRGVIQIELTPDENYVAPGVLRK